jgi:hypothetical protein
MTAEPTGDRASQGRLLVNTDEARELGPVEADGLLRECLLLTHKRFDAALWSALEALQTPAPEEGEGPLQATLGGIPNAEIELAIAVRTQRSRFIPQFKTVFDQLFQRRREGKRRTRGQRGDGSAFTLAIVDHGDHNAQVALKSAVQAMREATQEEGFGLDLRVRTLLREAGAEANFDNPWGADYFCDAFGTVCRELWPDGAQWRPIMERLVRATTPELAALHRELNVLLQDRDVLPTLRARAYVSGGGAGAMGNRALFDRLVEKIEPGQFAPGAGGAPAGLAGASAGPGGALAGPAVGPDAAPAGGPLWWLNGQVWSALVGVLSSLQRGQAVSNVAELASIDREAMHSGLSNELPALRAAVAGKGGSAIDLVTIDVIAGVLDQIFDDRYIPDEVKAILGRLQIPLLKAALLDRRVLSDPQHPARKFVDTLAAASVDLKPDRERDREFIALAGKLATRIRDEFDEDLGIFQVCKRELDTFLDADRARANEKLAVAVPSLIRQDQRAAARDDAAEALEARLAGRAVPKEIRDYLDHECVDRLTTISQELGSDSESWQLQLELVDDLLWSITPKIGAAAKKRLAETLSRLLSRIKEGWTEDADAQSRRQALMSRLFELHVASMKVAAPPMPFPVAPGQPVPQGMQMPQGIPMPAGMPMPQGTPMTQSGAMPPGAPAVPQAPAAPPVLAAPVPPLHEADEFDRQVMELVRGDWCSFKNNGDGEAVLARLAWRAPQRKRLLFCHRDGSTACVHSPETLAEAFRSGRASVAVEAIPLFDRAMGRLIDQFDEGKTENRTT